MPHLPPAHHETSKHDSPNEPKIKEKQNKTILDSNSHIAKSMTHHNQTKLAPSQKRCRCARLEWQNAWLPLQVDFNQQVGDASSRYHTHPNASFYLSSTDSFFN
jgi:hypothetical protein